MPSTRTARVFIAVMALACAAGAARPAAVAGPRQAEAGYLANWADLSTWSTPNPKTRQTEIGLGLVLDGDSGPMRLAFYVSQPTRGRGPAPATVKFRVASGAQMDPTLLRTPTLTFAAKVPAGKDKFETVKLDLSSSMTVDNPVPGAAITSAIGSMTAKEFQTLAGAQALGAVVLGARVEFRDNQRAALRAFRDRVFPRTE